MTQAEAATLQAWATVGLLALTAGYLIFVYQQSSAAQESTDLLVKRELNRQHAQLSMLFAAMLSLQSEAQRWLDTRDLIGHMHRKTIPEDYLQVENPAAIRDAAASGGKDLNEAVWRVLESTRDSRRELSMLRQLGDIRKGGRPAEPAKGFRQAITDVKELAMKAAHMAQEEADHLEKRLANT